MEDFAKKNQSEIKGELKKVVLDDFELYYEVYGGGNKVVMCLHGNDRSAEDFKFLAQPNRKIISIHHFLHQYSTFSPSRIDSGNVPVLAVEKLFEKILEQESVSRFNWVSYSQGGRFTLSTLPHFAKRLDCYYLISPDGMNNYNFYSWTQRVALTRWLFRHWVRKPNELLHLTSFLVKIKVLHPKILEFLRHYGENPDKLQRGYATWSSFRNLQPSYPKIKKALQENDIKFTLIIGKHDKIITLNSAQKFLKKIDQKNQLKIVPHGHNLFKPEILGDFYEWIEI